MSWRIVAHTQGSKPYRLGSAVSDLQLQDMLEEARVLLKLPSLIVEASVLPGKVFIYVKVDDK